MKRYYCYLLAAVVLLSLYGCAGGDGSGDKSAETPDSKTVISQAIDKLSKADSYELRTHNEEETVFGDKRTDRQTETITKAVLDPYAKWSKSEDLSTRIGGGKNRTIHETYVAHKDNNMTLHIRYSYQTGPEIEEEPVLSDWEKSYNITDQAIIDSQLRYNKNWILAELHLLRANINSFQPVADDAAESKVLMKYEGRIDPATVVEAYGIYLRESYIEMNFVTGKENPSAEDLKNEITGGRPEFQTGPTKLAFSESPVPVTLWIEKDSNDLKKVTVDETSVLQVLTEKAVQDIETDIGDPAVKKALVTYEIASINEFDQIPPPESLKDK